MRTAFAHVAVTANHGDLAGQHDVGGTLDAVGQGFAAAVKVVEFALRGRVVDVDRGNFEFAGFNQLLQAVDAGRGLFADALDPGEKLRIFLVNHVGEVTAIVQNHVQGFAGWEVDRLLDAPLKLFLCFAFPCVNRNARSGNGRSSVVLGAENVAA